MSPDQSDAMSPEPGAISPEPAEVDSEVVDDVIDMEPVPFEPVKPQVEPVNLQETEVAETDGVIQD